jgi:hypothetical protein
MVDMRPVISEDQHGNKRWYVGDSLHRIDGPAVVWVDGRHDWYLNGMRHRTDGPALVFPLGGSEWYVFNERHRTDGHAVEFSSGSKEWWLHNVFYTLDQWLDRTPGLTAEEKVMYKLQYG